VLVTFFSFK